MCVTCNSFRRTVVCIPGYEVSQTPHHNSKKYRQITAQWPEKKRYHTTTPTQDSIEPCSFYPPPLSSLRSHVVFCFEFHIPVLCNFLRGLVAVVFLCCPFSYHLTCFHSVFLFFYTVTLRDPVRHFQLVSSSAKLQLAIGLENFLNHPSLCLPDFSFLWLFMLSGVLVYV